MRGAGEEGDGGDGKGGIAKHPPPPPLYHPPIHTHTHSHTPAHFPHSTASHVHPPIPFVNPLIPISTHPTPRNPKVPFPSGSDRSSSPPPSSRFGGGGGGEPLLLLSQRSQCLPATGNAQGPSLISSLVPNCYEQLEIPGRGRNFNFPDTHWGFPPPFPTRTDPICGLSLPQGRG